MNLQEAIRDVCLHHPITAPFFVPVHQEAVTQQHFLEKEVQQAIRLTDQMMDRYYLGVNRVYDPVTKELWEKMRDFAIDRKIVFAAAKPLTGPTIADYPFGEDLPIHSVEFIHDAKYFTIQRGRHRHSPSKTPQFKVIMDTRVGTLRDVSDQDTPEAEGRRKLTDFLGEQIKGRKQKKLDLFNSIEQDLKEVKELPSPEPEDQ